jgi:ERCC4-type nuclease
MIRYLIDSREQKPYCFAGSATETKALSTGDYSVEFLDQSYEDQIAIERKSLSDFIGSITQGRERFEKEMKRGKTLKLFFVVIEGSWDDIYTENYRSRIPANSVINTILGWQVKYNVKFILAENRDRAEDVTKRLLDMFVKYKKRKIKKEKGQTSADLI